MEQLEKLVIRLKAGEQAVLGEIYEKTNRYVYFTCLGFLKNEQDATDIMSFPQSIPNSNT